MNSPQLRKDLARCNDCACMSLRQASRVVTQYYEEVLRPSGIHATQFSVLAKVAGLGPITMTELAEDLMMDRTTLTRNLKYLEDKKLVRVEAGEDLRTRQIELTRKGEKALSKALPLWDKAQSQIIRKLGRSNWDALRAELDALASAVS